MTMKNRIALLLLMLAGSAHAQEFTVPDGVNKCINTGVTTQCTLLGSLPMAVTGSYFPDCDDGYEPVITARGPMCAKDLRPPK